MQPLQVREAATAQCVNILYAYRRYCATASSTGQLILPEALKLMPLYMLAFNKMKPLQQKCEPDVRAALVAKVSAIPMQDLLPTLFPRLVALHKLANLPSDQLGGEIQPELLSCSSECMEDDACLLLLEESVGYVWVGLGVYPPVLEKLFGVSTFEMIQKKLDKTLVGYRGESSEILGFGPPSSFVDSVNLQALLRCVLMQMSKVREMGMTLAYALELLPHFALASASGSSLWRGVPWRRPRCLQNLLRTGRRTGCPMLSTCVTSIEKFRTSFCESRGWVEAKGWSKNKDRLKCFPKHYRIVSEGRLCGRNQTRLHSTSSLRFTVPLHFSLPQRHTKVSAELNL